MASAPRSPPRPCARRGGRRTHRLGARRRGHWRGRDAPRSAAAARRSTRSSRTGSRSRARWPRRAAAAFARSTWRCASTSTSTPTCGPVATHRRRAVALHERRPRHRAREHRGPLRGHRALRRSAPHARPSRSRSSRGSAASAIVVRVRVRAPPRPQEGHAGAQGQHPEDVERPVPRHRRARSPSAIPTSSSTT